MASDGSDEKYLLLKRDLYWRPKAQGYTGIRDYAGRWPKAEAERIIDPKGGVTMIAESEAPEFTDACWDDLARKHLNEQRDALRSEIETMKVEWAADLIRLGKERGKVEAERDALAARLARLEKGLEWIRDFPRPGYPRRDEDGYPMEILYDEFSYRRLVDTYRDSARAALTPSAAQEARDAE